MSRFFLAYLFVALTLNTFNVQAQTSCFALFSEVAHSVDPSEIELIRLKWAPSNFSKPSSHNPKKFSYIVKVIVWKDDLVTNIESARKISDLKIMSVSVISDKHTRLYLGRESGYILEVPEANIISSNPIDYIFAKIKDADFPGLNTPEDLLAKSRESKTWNEVRITGRNGSSEVKIAGIFYSPFVGPGNLLENPRRPFLEQLASDLGVPLVAIDIDQTPSADFLK